MASKKILAAILRKQICLQTKNEAVIEFYYNSFYVMAYLYVLYSGSLDRFYIGSTRGSLEERLRRHLSEHKGYTGKAKDWIVCYSEFYADYKDASSREQTLKRQKDRRGLELMIARSSGEK